MSFIGMMLKDVVLYRKCCHIYLQEAFDLDLATLKYSVGTSKN